MKKKAKKKSNKADKKSGLYNYLIVQKCQKQSSNEDLGSEGECKTHGYVLGKGGRTHRYMGSKRGAGGALRLVSGVGDEALLVEGVFAVEMHCGELQLLESNQK